MDDNVQNGQVELLEQVNSMESKIRKLGTIIIVLSLMAGAAFALQTLVTAERTRQLRNVRLAYYKHPCIVIKVDNLGCQAELEMRTEVAVVRR